MVAGGRSESGFRDFIRTVIHTWTYKYGIITSSECSLNQCNVCCPCTVCYIRGKKKCRIQSIDKNITWNRYVYIKKKAKQQ